MKVRSFLIAIFAITLLACGGSISGFDVFQPRAVVTSDIEMKQFSFGWLPNGNPIKEGVGTFTLMFGEMDSSGTAPIAIEVAEGGSASGTSTLSGAEIVLSIGSSTIPGLPVGHNTNCRIEADVDDGRIRLTNVFSGSEATSDLVGAE